MDTLRLFDSRPQGHGHRPPSAAAVQNQPSPLRTRRALFAWPLRKFTSALTIPAKVTLSCLAAAPIRGGSLKGTGWSDKAGINASGDFHAPILGGETAIRGYIGGGRGSPGFQIACAQYPADFGARLTTKTMVKMRSGKPSSSRRTSELLSCRPGEHQPPRGKVRDLVVPDRPFHQLCSFPPPSFLSGGEEPPPPLSSAG